jgi:glycogen phosphorylase
LVTITTLVGAIILSLYRSSFMIGNLTENATRLRRLFVEPKLPAGLEPLMELAQNLWWSWNTKATDLFLKIDAEALAKADYNPIALLEQMGSEKAESLLKDAAFMKQMKAVYADFKAYMSAPKPKNQPRIAYFCMEYGLHQSMRLYSGGLGVLAGDYIKEASDSHADFVAIGLLYRYGYFQQDISLHGEQIHHYDAAKFTQLPIEPVRDAQGEWVKIFVNFGQQTIWAKVWELKVGRVSVYLLDTDIEDNKWEFRSVTHYLYGGDNENRLRQEILLGIGGYRVLKALQLPADVYHLNEGHAAFLGLERLKHYIKNRGFSFDQSLEIVRATQLFTTHTPVPAGHDSFSEALMQAYLHDIIYDLDIDWRSFLKLGKEDVDDQSETFSMSHLAITTSIGLNGVSWLHGDVSRKMFNHLYPDYHHSEVPIGFVTNSIHYPTWTAPEWQEFYEKHLGKDTVANQTKQSYWEKIKAIPDNTIVELRKKRKAILFEWLRKSLQVDLTDRGVNPRDIFEIINNLREDALVIGFARRFATYKRATLLFSNPERLSQMINQQDRPVIFLFAGKAHPADKAGQEFIRLIYHTTQDPRFKGKVIFLENYSMEMAKLLVSGVDIWLNNPMRPKEASGTSGMKAIMNGVMNFSVLDGWWVEGYQKGAGWSLPLNDTYTDQALQNELDAEMMYNTFENEIIPTYYDEGKAGAGKAWVSHIKNTIAHIVPQFTMRRMLDDYNERFYYPLFKRGKTLADSGFKRATALAEWKQKISSIWPAIELVHIDMFDSVNHSLHIGDDFTAKVTIKLMDVSADQIGVELVFFKRISEKELDLIEVVPLKHEKTVGSLATYHCSFKPGFAGVSEYGFRMYPKHPDLTSKTELPLVKWL